MKIPVVMVHGIGQLGALPHDYFKTWIKHSWKTFEPVFYNAGWWPHAFNMNGSYANAGIGFRDLSSLSSGLLQNVPIMARIAYLAASKIRALESYQGALPWYKRVVTATANKFLFKFLGVEAVDFGGDVLTYLQWEEYTLEKENPIKKVVKETIFAALRDFPDQPIHIVCHSLGTKIVWDVLNEMDLPASRIGLLMTMSSPLQPMAILGWVRKEDNTKYLKPRCVDHWLNVYDVRDLVGAPIGSKCFKRTNGFYLTWKEVMNMDPLPCANVCTEIGLFPWSAHMNAWTAWRPKYLFKKYISKYLDS